MKYKCKVIRTVVESTIIEVNAGDEDAAAIQAEEQAGDVEEKDWTLEDVGYETDEISEVEE